MEEDEMIEEILSRFQTLIAGLKVLNKGCTTSNHVKKSSEVCLRNGN